jgi:plastocyanin
MMLRDRLSAGDRKARNLVVLLGAFLLVVTAAIASAHAASRATTRPHAATSKSPSSAIVPAPPELEQQLRRRLTVGPAAPRAGGYLPGATHGPDVEHLRYRYGPFEIGPGQNPNLYDGGIVAPARPGFITRFEPNLVLENGEVPAANILHLHHGVWLVNNEARWFADAEKSVFVAPRGYGWRTNPSDRWVLNHMLHNLYPTHARAYLTWDIDFVPSTSPTARTLRPIESLWMDVRGGEAYPVFDVPYRPAGSGRLVYPTDLRGAAKRRYPKGYNERIVTRDGTLVLAVGHLHPGGLWNVLTLRRGSRSVVIHRGEARYFDPAGPVSWDMAMGVTRDDWRVRVRRGDVLSLTTTYDTRHGAWYEAMGVMVVGFAPGDRRGADPFSGDLDRRTRATHGRLAENRGSGGAPTSLPIASLLPAGRSFGLFDDGAVEIRDFVYSAGDLSLHGSRQNPPTVPMGLPLRFVNDDAAVGVPHTVTACRLPCNRSAGHGYPRADGPVQFDSGELGFGLPGITAFANRSDWSAPTNLRPGTYTYFCRIHPFMRGAFRVRPLTPQERTLAVGLLGATPG